jgi:hypothetical protein
MNAPALTSRLLLFPEVREQESAGQVEHKPRARRYRLARLAPPRRRPDRATGFQHLKRIYD